MGKKLKQELLGTSRQSWHISPITKVKPNKKAYSRVRDKQVAKKEMRMYG